MNPFDRTAPPGPGKLRTFDFPDFERARLPNGLELLVCRIARLPVVSAHLFTRSGEAGLGNERAGLSVLTGDALEGGTAKRSGSELAEALEGLGARLGVSTGWEGTSVELSCLADRLADALPLIAETVLEPAFPEAEVERAREQRLATIRQRAKDPGSLANDRAVRQYFAPDTPYARPQGGTEASIAGIQRDDLLGYANECYRPGDGGLIIVGDVDAAEVEALALDCFGAWEGTPPGGLDFDPRPSDPAPGVWVVDRPGSVQSEIRVGHVGTVRTSPDYFPLSIGNLILGGSFTSRLNLNLREKNGFTYGVRSRFGFRTKPGPFQVSTAVATEVTAGAVREIFHELDTLVADGVTGTEVAAARDYAAGIFGLQLETAGQIAVRIMQTMVYGLADDYHKRYRDELRAVTVEGVTSAMRRHVRPQEARVVVVGDAKAIVDDLTALGRGPVEVVREAGA